MRLQLRSFKSAQASLVRNFQGSKYRVRKARFKPGLDLLDDRIVLSTTLAGNIAQGNLYGDQSVVLASSILQKSGPTQIQLIDTGDIGMGQQSVRTFVPFKNYKGTVSMTVGDFLHKGYQQLIVGTTGKVETRVAIFDLYQSFVSDTGAATTGVFANPVRLQEFTPFQGFKGGVSLASADLNDDGVDDVIVGAGPGGSPLVRIYSEGKADGNGSLPAAPTLLNSFRAFDARLKGGVSLAAGHLSGKSSAELIVGAGAGGGSNVAVFDGGDVVSKANPKAVIKYRAFGDTKKPDQSPVQVQLVESIVAPDTVPVTGLDAQGLTSMFTPSNNAPLVRGTIVAYDPRATTKDSVSLYSLASGSAESRKVHLPNTSPSGQGNFKIQMTPVGYLFDKSVNNALAPMVLVANATQSTVSLFPLSGDHPNAVKNIFTSNLTAAASPEYNSDSFPFGLGVSLQIPQAVKVLKSDIATEISPGTSGMLPSRQVAYQSPFQLQFQSDPTKLFSRYNSSFFANQLDQTTLPLNQWYKTPSNPNDFYGPSLAVFGQNAQFPAITSNDQTFWRESMIAAGLQYMNQGVYYQHHHFPAWFGVPTDTQKGVGPNIADYGLYSYTPAGMQTPGLDCSDYSALVVNMVTGQKIKEGISEQATVSDGKTDWGTTLEGTSDIYINNDKSQGVLSWYTLAAYYEQNGALATYQMLNKTLQPGDMLYYGNIPSGSIDSTASLTIDTAAHVTIWTGQSMPIPGQPADSGVPLIMDSHGGNIQTSVDANNNPTGVVEPAGPQIRPFFVPNATGTSSSYVALKDFLTSAQLASQNNYYFTNFTHAIRINFPVNNGQG